MNETIKLDTVDKELFDRVMRITETIGVHEIHFNNLETEYRKLASQWLLAALGGCGLLMKIDTKTFVENWVLVLGVSLAGSIGIAILWMMDIKVYHRLLHTFFKEGVRLEADFTWMRPIRINMVKSQETGDVTTRIMYYYFLSISLLTVVSISAIWNISFFPSAIIRLLLTFVLLLLLGIVWWWMRENGKSNEVLTIISDYDKAKAAENKESKGH
ncbi:MAG: hypothetical protein ABWZ25_07420 [Chitinophagaceae bacterium]